MSSSRIVKVDGNNNVVVAIAADVRGRAAETSPLLRRVGTEVAIKIGAAGARYIGDIAGLGQDPRRWPSALPRSAEDLIVRALPYAEARIDTMRASGRRVPFAVYSNDLARAKGESPARVNQAYRASASSTAEYESSCARSRGVPIRYPPRLSDSRTSS